MFLSQIKDDRMSNFLRKFQINKPSSFFTILVLTKMDFSEKRQKWRQILNGTLFCDTKVETNEYDRGKEGLNG